MKRAAAACAISMMNRVSRSLFVTEGVRKVKWGVEPKR